MSGADPSEADTRDLAGSVDAFVADQAARGGVQAVSIDIVRRDGGAAIRGRVLTQRQARDVREIARRHGATAVLEVVADPESGLEEDWVTPVIDVLDLWREPSRAGEEMDRQTQHLALIDGPLRRLGSQGDLLLLQGIDLAMGWGRADQVEPADPDRARILWAAVTRAEEGHAVAAREPVSAEGLLERARRMLGAPYIWGATGAGGYDCSGLVQRVVELTGVVLPRHTADQRRVGARVLASDARAGDLLFARPRTQKVGHVMLMTSPSTLLHACRTEHRVIEETLEDNAARYQHQGWRRPVDLGA